MKNLLLYENFETFLIFILDELYHTICFLLSSDFFFFWYALRKLECQPKHLEGEADYI